LIGLGFLVLGATVAVTIPLILPVNWLAAHRLIDGTRLGVAGGTTVGFIVIQLVVYGYHRAAHGSSFLWRWLHQMHHASRRIDTSASMIFHPFELVVQQALTIGMTTFVLGLEPLAASIIGYLLASTTMFQHINVRTPVWLGYLIQRPESHCIHHQTNVHAFNYAHLPLWDIVFRTFRNPERFEGRVGLGDETAWEKMFLGRDVGADRGADIDPAYEDEELNDRIGTGSRSAKIA
jgi:sterol desaturase/sphingolipid hydroxylase (fatty acid hydroxylase superfamily)